MYRLSFSILLSVFCFGFSVYAKTLENPPNAYLIDHRGIPHFDENDVMQSASYSDLQTAGLSTDHLQIHPDGDEFYWEIPTEDISTDDYAKIGAPPGFPAVRFAGDVYAFQNQYYFVPKDESAGFPADAYDAGTSDFHFLPSAQAVANRIENNRATIGPAFHNSPDTNQPIVYTLPNISLPTLDYGDTVTLENDFADVIALQLSDGGTGDITLTGNGNLSSVLDLGSVITSHEQITIDTATGAASITLPDANTSTFSFSNQRWLSYTTTDTNGDPWRVGVYVGTGDNDSVGDDIFQTSTLLADIHEIVVYGLAGIDSVFFNPSFVPSTVVAGQLFGGSGNDTLIGINNSSSTILHGEEGEDLIQGRSNDIIFGGSGNDDLSVHNDGVTHLTIFGGGDDDSIYGGSGDQRLYGGTGADIIYSYGGHDVVFGGIGNDQIHAGDGVDIFVFDGNGDGSDQVGTPSTDFGDDIFQNNDKLYFVNTSMSSRDDLSISAAVVNSNEIVSIAYTDTPLDNNINLFHIDIENSHLIRRSNIIFEDTSGNVVVHVDEGATAAVYWPVVTDENFDYSAISHSISGSGADNERFSIDVATGGLSFNDTPIANNPLDANSDEVYEVTLLISDGTNAISQNLLITVLETTPPTITSSAVASPIDSGSGAGQVIYTIEATDNVGVSSYRIAYGDAADFSVNPSTGEVTLLENPDYESKSSYHFEARAEDAAGNMTSLNVSLEINQALDLADVHTSRVFYTNPVWDQLEIRSESIIESVVLYSLTGRRVFERKPNETALTLDISSLAQGVYLMKVKTTTNQTTVKLVKL